MTEMTFEWDEKKNRINKRKHGISFEEAETVFYDNQDHFRSKSNEKWNQNLSRRNAKVIKMRDEYDIKKLNPRPNPYADKLKKQITIRLNASTIEYFKQQAEETGISYQNLINMYLTDCAVHEKKLEYTIK